MLKRLTIAAILIGIMALTGCSGGDASTETSGDAETASGAAAESAVIVLEEGWAIQDVITPEEVGDIVGATLTYFPEASSAAQDGEPVASYQQENVEDSKVLFAVDDDGGQEEYDIMKGFAVEGSVEEISGLGDEAVALEYEDGNIGVLVLKGDTVISIVWQWDVYGSDAAGLGTQLAELLMGKMYE